MDVGVSGFGCPLQRRETDGCDTGDTPEAERPRNAKARSDQHQMPLDSAREVTAVSYTHLRAHETLMNL
eukprot:4603561-Prymnesium_polylepis.1